MTNALFPLLLAVLSAGGSAASGTADPCDAPAAAAASHGSPFACDRLSLDPVARRRHFDELGPALRSLRRSVRELPDGYEFEFPTDPKTIAMVAEWVAGERVCCPFFEIQMRADQEHGPFWLRLTGRPGTKDFIKVDGASWIQQ